MAAKDKTLLLIDSFALIHRAYHAFAKSGLSVDGQPVHALYGFAGLLLDVLEKFQPSHVIAVFDVEGPTVRHQQYGAYKANRSKPEDDMVSQIPRIEELLNMFNIPVLKVAGFEADDVIGTIDARHSGTWARTVIVTGDRDLFQLVDEDTFVYLAGGSFSQSALFDAKGVEAKMGIPPERIIDYKAIHGDPSDNIPGVHGIGEKGAVELISQFGPLEDIYKHIAETGTRYQQKLTENQELAFLSKQLATIITDVPISFDFENAEFGGFDVVDLRQFFQEMRFKSLFAKLEKVVARVVPSEAESDGLGLADESSAAPAALPAKAWEGQKLSAKELFIIGEYQLEGDVLGWRVAQLLVSDGLNTLSVSAEQLADFLTATSSAKLVVDNGKALLHHCASLSLTPPQHVYDICIASYISSAGRSGPDLDSVFGYYQQPFAGEPVAKVGHLIGAYQAHQKELATEADLQKVVDMELQLLPVVVQMEQSGVKLDKANLQKAQSAIEKQVAKTEQEIYKQVGHEFNIGSPKQVGDVLFGQRGLPGGKKTKTGGYSTDERVLRELAPLDPVVDMILQFRELSKLLNTYIRPLPEYINPFTGRVHATFNQVGAISGRFSSTNPNLQNLPLGEVAGVTIRDAFVAEAKTVYVSFDYSQQELRLLAEFAGEKNMQAAFAAGEDIHARTAVEMFGIKDIKSVTKEQRKVAKTINFGIVYGMSAFGLADRLKIDQRTATDFIRKYFERYPQVQQYYQELINKARTDGYVQTVLGRRRDTTDLSSTNFQLRQAVEREVKNFPLQGSAADIIKLAMVEIGKFLSDFPAKLVLQIHDELVFEYRLPQDQKFVDFVQQVRQTMLEVIKLKVPFQVGVEVGTTLAQMQEYE